MNGVRSNMGGVGGTASVFGTHTSGMDVVTDIDTELFRHRTAVVDAEQVPDVMPGPVTTVATPARFVLHASSRPPPTVAATPVTVIAENLLPTMFTLVDSADIVSATDPDDTVFPHISK